MDEGTDRRGGATENGRLGGGEEKMKKKMFTTESTEITESEYIEMR
jgi:hypothetical protein